MVFIVVIFLVFSFCSEAGETPPDPRANESNDNDPGYSLARTCIDISGVKLPKDANLREGELMFGNEMSYECLTSQIPNIEPDEL